MIFYNSTIEEDDFGWVDPLIYIHVEPPDEYVGEDFYWWNVTGHPYQRSLAGNRPPYRADWVENGRNILVQSPNTLPEDCIDIDDDSYWEIFARVEIDGSNMFTQDVVYIDVGNVSDIQIANRTGDNPPLASVQINASYYKTTNTWPLIITRDVTNLIFEEELTPTGKAVTYPTISEVVSGFHLESYNFSDDSIYQLRVDYLNLTGAQHNLFAFQLGSQLGIDSGKATYPSTPTAGWTWSENPAPPTDVREVTCTFSPQQTAESLGNYKYGNIIIDATNFLNKTIKTVRLDLDVTYQPELVGSGSTTLLYQDFIYTRPSSTRIYLFREDINSGGVVMQGSPGNLNTKTATSAWFNYTVPVPSGSFLNGIDWDVKAWERMSTGSSISITDVVIEYYNETSSSWWRLYAAEPDNEGSPLRWQPENEAPYVGSGYLDDFADLVAALGVGPQAHLYLTLRNESVFETISLVKFAARIQESVSAYPNDGVGYMNGTSSPNTSALVSFIFRQYINAWHYEITEGFVSDFTVTIVMYDPIGIRDTDIDSRIDDEFLPEALPNVSISYDQMGPLNNSIILDYEDLNAQKVLVYLEAWDSLVRDIGMHGDILFRDNQTSGPQRLVPLTYQPVLNTTIEVIDLEAMILINVSIDADQTIRNYYLQMNISPALGYERDIESVAYISNFRFSLGSTNTEAMKSMGAYPSKKILAYSYAGFPSSLRVGLADLSPSPIPYVLMYILRFEVSPEFIMNTTARETMRFTAIWEKAEGTYEVRDDKMLSATRQIDVVYV
jgi:hypothetical protein